ncbi:hypothetical protein IC582_024614 [Cucumis melo]
MMIFLLLWNMECHQLLDWCFKDNIWFHKLLILLHHNLCSCRSS